MSTDLKELKKNAQEDWHPNTFRVPDIAQMALPVLQERVVDCGSCPVSMECKFGNGEKGTGIVCGKCNSTGVVIGADSVSEGAVVYLVDCTQHKFKKATQESTLKECPMCTGIIARAEMRMFGDPLTIGDHTFLIRGVGEVQNIQWPTRPEDVLTLDVEDVSILPVQGVILTEFSSVSVKARQETFYNGFKDALVHIPKQRQHVLKAKYEPPKIDLQELEAAEKARAAKKKKDEEEAKTK